jgi:hypothetical protein
LKTASCLQNLGYFHIQVLPKATQVSLTKYRVLKLSEPSTTISNLEMISEALLMVIFSSKGKTLINSSDFSTVAFAVVVFGNPTWSSLYRI